MNNLINEQSIYIVMKQILVLASLCFSLMAVAQKDPIKWGKISQDEANLQTVAFDSSANAVVICDYGRVFVTTGDGVIFRRHIRIKILNEAAKDEADIAIPYYHSNEKIISHNAQTVNIVNGKPKKKELSKKEFFKAKVNEKWSQVRFTFPDVQAGSIIEYTYSVKSENYTNLEPWNFQSDLPTLKSFFFASIDGKLNYKIMYQGHALISKYQNKSVNTWELKNLPAIKDDVLLCPNPFDYTEQLKFQLASYLGPSGYYQEVMGSWKDVAKDMYTLGGMKQYLSKNKDASKIVSRIVNKEEDSQTKIKKIYNYVVQNYTWNERYRMLPNADYKEFKEKGIGTSAEINLFFINLIQSAGLEATPTLVSTKQNGFVAKDITFYSQFNHVIACVKVNEEHILIDATSPFRPYDLLDQEDLNREALVLNKKEPFWIPLTANKKTKSTKLVHMDVPEPGLVKYKLEVNLKGYDAVDARENIDGQKGKLESFFNKEVLKENAEYQIDAIETKNLEDVSKSLYYSAEIIDKSLSTVNDDFIYISPFVDQYLSSNPFNEKERYLPIDFYYPFEDTYILNFNVPEGYEIIEYPESLNLATEGQKGIFRINSKLIDERLQLRITFAIKNPFFAPYEYSALREIYDMYIEKREEQIVLKKKA